MFWVWHTMSNLQPRHRNVSSHLKNLHPMTVEDMFVVAENILSKLPSTFMARRSTFSIDSYSVVMEPFFTSGHCIYFRLTVGTIQTPPTSKLGVLDTQARKVTFDPPLSAERILAYACMTAGQASYRSRIFAEDKPRCLLGATNDLVRMNKRLLMIQGHHVVTEYTDNLTPCSATKRLRRL